MKKFLSVLLAVTMVLSTVSFALPAAVNNSDFASEPVVVDIPPVAASEETADLAADDTWYDTTKGTLLFNMDFDTDNSGNAVASTAYDGLSLSSYSAGSGELVSGLGRLNPDVTDNTSYDMGFRYTTAANTTLVEENGNKYLSLSSSGSNQISLYLGNTYTKTGTYVFEYSYKLVSTGTTTANCITYNTLTPVEGGTDTYTFDEWVTETATFEVSSIPSYSRVMFYGAGNYSTSDVLYLDDIKVWYYDTTVDYEEKVNGSTGNEGEEVSEWANTDKGYKLFVIDFETKNDGTALTSDDYSAITTGRCDSSPTTAGVAVSAIGRVNPNYTVNTRVNVKAGSGAALAGTDDLYLAPSTAGDSLIFGSVYVGDGTYVFEFETDSAAVLNGIRGSYGAGATPEYTTVDSTWTKLTHTVTGVTEATSTSCSSYGTDNIRFYYTTKPTMYDNIVVYYQPTGWTAPDEGGEEPEPETPVINDVWEDETKGTKLFTIDFEAKNDGTALDSTSWDSILNRLDNYPETGELISDIGRINPEANGSDYRISINYIDNSLTALVKDGDNTTLELAPQSGKGDLSLYLGGFYEGEGTYTFETSYKFVQTGTNAVGQIRYETIGAVYTDSSYFSTGDWVNLSEVHEHASSDTHADVNRLRITTPDFSNTPYATTDRIYLDNITVYYKAPAVEPEEPEETTEVWYDRTKGTLLFNMDFETDNDGNAVTSTAVDVMVNSGNSYTAASAAAVSTLGRLNPDVEGAYTAGFRYVTDGSEAVVSEDGNQYLSVTSSGSNQISLYVGNSLFTKTGTYTYEVSYKFVASSTTTLSSIRLNEPTATTNDTNVTNGDWATWTNTFTYSSGDKLRNMFNGSTNFSTGDKLYLDNVKLWYYDESVDYDEILGEEDKGEWNPDATLGTKLFVIDLDGDTNYTTADLSKLTYRIDGTSDNSDSNGLYAEAIGRVNPDYATTYANTFKYAFKDGGTPTVSGDTDKYFTHTATTNPSVMVANPFVGAGTYTLVFNHEAAKTFNVHSGYTGGTATTTVIDDTWAQTSYTIDISEQGANDYFRIIGTAGATTYLIDDIALYYKNTAATVTVYANGNANVSDTVVTVNSDTGMTAAELVAKVDTSASAKELLGASLTADGELLAADYVVMPGSVSGIYLIWGDDIVVDEEPWWEDGLGTLLFDINWDGTLATTEQTRWADVRAAGASTNPDWKNFEKMYFMWGTEDIGGGSTWVPATSPLIVAEANGNRYYRQPHNSTYNSWSLYSTFDGDWAGWADGDGVFTITYKVKTVGNITANNLFLDTTLVYNHATTRQDIRHFYSTLPDSNGWLTVTVQFDTSEYTTNVGETLGQLLFYVQTNESSAVADAYICYDDVQVYYKPSKVNVTMKPGTCLEVTETVVEASTAGILASDLIALVDTQDTTLLPTGLTNEDGSVKYALTDTVVLDADTTLVITWESNEWMDNELGMLIQKADFEGEIQTTTINRWPAATALGATINPDYSYDGVTGLQFTVASTGIAFDESYMWIPSDYDVIENGNTYFEVPTGNKAYGTSTQYSQISMYAMGSGASQYAYEGAGTYTITGKVKYGSDIQNAYFEVRPNAYNGSGLTGGFNYQFTEVVAGEWNEFSVTWSTEESAAYGLGSVEFYLFYDALSEASTIAYDDIMLYYKPFTAEITLRANNNPVAKDIVLSDVSTSGITVDELLSNIRTPLGGMDLVGLAYDKAGTNMLEGTVVVGGDARFFMIWKESELDPNAPVSENVNAIRTDDPIGMRFRSYMTTSVYESAATVGWVVTRYDLLEEQDINPYDFYLETDVTKVQACNKDAENNISKVFNSDDINTYITAVLYNIPEAHYETTLVARPFTIVDGVTYYGYPIERSICEVAEAIRDGGYAGCSNDQLTYIKSILEVCGKSTEPTVAE